MTRQPTRSGPGGPGPRFFQGLVIGVLGAVVVANLVLLRVASSDPAAGIEPDYYGKAARWDESVAARERSDRLGWRADVAARLDASGNDIEAVLTLTDRTGAAIDGAALELEAFAVARSAERHRVAARTGPDGAARVRLPRGRPGRWELRVVAHRGEDAFVGTLRADVARESAP